MNNKSKILSLVVFLAIAISIIAGVILVRQNQNINEKAAPTTNILFNPSSVDITKGQNFTTKVIVSTGTNLVTGIDIELVFNPTVIQITQIVPTSALSIFTNVGTGQVIKNEINNTTGKARFIAYVLDKNNGLSGQKDILTISGTVASNAQPAVYQINYGSLTSIAAMNESQNSLLSKTSFSLNVVTPTPSASPTATPTKSPSTSPTPSPTSSRSPSPSPTASPLVYLDWDVDRNGSINIIDMGLVVDDYGNSDPIIPRADVDKSGIINIIDIGIIVDHYQ